MTNTDFQQEMDAVKQDLKDLRKDLRDLLSALGAEGGERAEDLKQRLIEQARLRAEQVRAGAAHVCDYGRQVAQQAGECVERHPIGAIATALGAGIILGWLLLRRD